MARQQEIQEIQSKAAARKADKAIEDAIEAERAKMRAAPGNFEPRFAIARLRVRQDTIREKWGLA